jgi:hypothetical protein
MQKKLAEFNIPAVAQGSKNKPVCLALPRQEYPATQPLFKTQTT